ncbi:hypothetical protein [Yinghuangia soli]|uniref:Uncharacterized protein n=1 Tax=Yinghuangia soli TaxID=2908204 RepID=A0AA41Q7G1_9ACTN|nr:hypothetical protein [Yinghuangia soli]MCF2532101.1 hypothetical protein [Yinghuangia soli]
MAALLVRHRAEQKKVSERLGEAWHEHGLIFPSKVGTPLAPDNFSHEGRPRALAPARASTLGRVAPREPNS